MRHVLLTLMLAPPVVCLLALLALRAQLIRFQRDVPRLGSADDLRRFKRLAKVQMYGTLLVFALIGLPLLVWGLGKFVGGALDWLDLLLYVILPFAALVLILNYLDAPAEDVRATPADTPEFERERDHVAQVWVDKNFPEW